MTVLPSYRHSNEARQPEWGRASIHCAGFRRLLSSNWKVERAIVKNVTAKLKMMYSMGLLKGTAI